MNGIFNALMTLLMTSLLTKSRWILHQLLVILPELADLILIWGTFQKKNDSLVTTLPLECLIYAETLKVFMPMRILMKMSYKKRLMNSASLFILEVSFENINIIILLYISIVDKRPWTWSPRICTNKLWSCEFGQFRRDLSSLGFCRWINVWCWNSTSSWL